MVKNQGQGQLPADRHHEGEMTPGGIDRGATPLLSYVRGWPRLVGDEWPDAYPVPKPRGAKPGLLQALQELGMVEQDRRELEAAEAQVIAEARRLGAGWGIVGMYVGLSPEGARIRYTRSKAAKSAGGEV